MLCRCAEINKNTRYAETCRTTTPLLLSTHQVHRLSLTSTHRSPRLEALDPGRGRLRLLLPHGWFMANRHFFVKSVRPSAAASQKIGNESQAWPQHAWATANNKHNASQQNLDCWIHMALDLNVCLSYRCFGCTISTQLKSTSSIDAPQPAIHVGRIESNKTSSFFTCMYV